MASAEKQVEHRGWRFPFGFFAGPILWGLQIIAGYGLVTVSCNIANKWPLYFLIGLSGLVVLAAAIVAYGAWRALPRREDTILLATDRTADTSAFLAVSGFIVSALFLVVILATVITDLFLSPCPIITMPLP